MEVTVCLSETDKTGFFAKIDVFILFSPIYEFHTLKMYSTIFLYTAQGTKDLSPKEPHPYGEKFWYCNN